MCHSTPGKDLETPARSRRPKKPRWIFGENLGTVEEEVEPKQAQHDDTPRPDELGLEEDLDATLTNEGTSDADNTVCEETVRDKQITAYRAGLGSPPCIQDEFCGVEDTTNDEALAGVMAENYADEEEEDRRLREQGGATNELQTPSNNVEPTEAKSTRSGQRWQ